MQNQTFEHNQVAAACREVLGYLASECDEIIYRYAAGYNGESSANTAKRHFRQFLERYHPELSNRLQFIGLCVHCGKPRHCTFTPSPLNTEPCL